jgi:4'-phosphopantetheinyl transferase
MQIEWLRQTSAQVPSGNDWLCPEETERLSQLRISKRRIDWRLGRWTIKRAVANYLQMPEDERTLACIQVRPASSGAPKVFFGSEPASVSVSLSHRDGTAFCAVGPLGMRLGCDLEAIEPHSQAFIDDYFTPNEQNCIAESETIEERTLRVVLIWSAKESALKALETGLRSSTRSASAWFPADHRSGQLWRPMMVVTDNRDTFTGWWQQSNHLLYTIASAPGSANPIEMQGTM